MNDVVKVDRLEMCVARISPISGKEIDHKTCGCYQCETRRAMDEALAWHDGEFRSLELHYRAEYLDRVTLARAHRAYCERRQRIVQYFINAGYTGLCTSPMMIVSPMKVEQEQIEVARDAWQEDEGATDRWRVTLEDHPVPIQNYIGKRFEKERDELRAAIVKLEAAGKDAPPDLQPRFRITSLNYMRNTAGQWEVTDNTPGE